MCGEEEHEVPNPYLAVIRAKKAASAVALDELHHFLDDAMALFETGMWISPEADDFYAELAMMKMDAGRIADSAEREFDDAIRGQPEMVAPDSWQAHWRSMGWR